MKKRIPQVVFGLLLIGAGVAFVGRSLGLWHFQPFFDGWWTLFLLVPAVASMLSNGPHSGNVLLALVGILLLLQAQGLLRGVQMWSLLFALLLVWCGVRLLFPRRAKNQNGDGVRTNYGGFDFQDEPHYTVIFSGNRAQNACKSLKGATATAVLGCLEVDFSQAWLEQDVQLDVYAVMGKVRLILPSQVNLAIKGTPILGRVVNQVPLCENVSGYTLQIDATAVLGEIEILKTSLDK